MAPTAAAGQWYGFGALSYVFSNADHEYVTSGASNVTSIDLDGVAGTLGLGHRWDKGDYVVGFEIDATSGNNSQSTLNGSTAPCLTGHEGCTGDMDWMATARVVVGRDYGSYHPYATAGIAVSKVTGTADTGACGASTCDIDDVLAGVVIGLGIKRQFDDMWALRGEYLYTDLGGGHAFTTSSTVGDYAFGVLRIGLERSF